jgi:hypothetical protein
MQLPAVASQRWPLLHGVQVAPFFPQALSLCTWHWVPLQQPPAHEAAVHWQVAAAPVPTHCWPAPQAAWVPQPQAPLVRQRLETKESQLWQAVPPAPQVGKPAVVQVLPLAQQPAQPLVPSHTQAAPSQRRPAPQAAPVVPHTHAPAVQRLAFWASHAVQAPPSRPQSVGPGGVTQLWALQQPLAQESPSHTHWLPLQR